MRDKSKRLFKGQSRRFLSYLLGGLGIVALLWLILGNLDWYDPWLTLKPEVNVLGPKTGFIVEGGDRDAGLRDLKVTVSQDGGEKEVITKAFPAAGGFFGGGSRVTTVEVPFEVEAQALGLKEGKAVLTVTAHDRSWRNGFKGRVVTLTRQVTVDLIPLRATFQSVNHLLHSGGTGTILYQLTKPAKESGIAVAGRFYQGFPNPRNPKGELQVLFPIPREAAGSLMVELVARPQVGEEIRQKIPLKVRPRKWRQDQMNLSDDFLRKVASTFPVSNPSDLLGAYLFVNREIRQKNHDKVRQVCSQSQPQPLWTGSFLRYEGKPMARYGDKRTYVYHGKAVDQQIHLGEDLADLEKTPVPAGNSGVVALAEPLGIYGDTVIIDHGLGVFSMYSHLSSLEVKGGQKVEKGKIVGRTGTTGLAGGDHLHFSMAIQGEFVDPLEWWDPHWLKDQVEGQWARSGTATAASPASADRPQKTTKKPAGKKAKKGKGRQST